MSTQQVHTLTFGVEGMEPISGTVEEIIAILEGYPITVVQDVFAAEVDHRHAKPELYRALRRYLASRFTQFHFDGRD